MTRTIPLLFVLLTGACSVGALPGLADDDDNPDGGVDPATIACVDRQAPGTAHDHLPATTGGAGTKRGESCVESGCHKAGALGVTDGTTAPAFTAAGTVFNLDGATPSAGATIRIFSGGKVITAISDTDGNFNISAAITFPATTHTTACPNFSRMVSSLVGPNDGSCSNTGCHGGPAGKILQP